MIVLYFTATKKMKTLPILVTLLFATIEGYGQNLVPNPSFEQGACPTGIAQLDSATGWISIQTTPEYFNRCAVNDGLTGNCSVPVNDFGFQNAPDPSCAAYVGIATYNPFYPNNHEIIGCELITALNIGQKYFISFKTALATSEYGAGSNNLGVLFKTTQLPHPVGYPNANRAQIKSNYIITDTTNWTTIYGSFISDSAYQFLEIGNFFDDSLTVLADASKVSYYFIDDVCVSTDSAFTANYLYTCGPSRIIEEQIIFPELFPNPATNSINLSYNSGLFSLIIYNSIGDIILNVDKQNSNLQIDVSQFPPGLYLADFEVTGKHALSKFIVSR